jgi:hypothetical protein
MDKALMMLKFSGVLLFVGGAVGSFVATGLRDRRRAVHRVAGVGAIAMWCGGYLLARWRLIAVTEAWMLGAFTMTVVTQMALIASVAREGGGRVARVVAGAGIAGALALMVVKPTW